MSTGEELAVQINAGRALMREAPGKAMVDTAEATALGEVYDPDGLGILVDFLGQIAGDGAVSYGLLQSQSSAVARNTEQAAGYFATAAEGENNDHARNMAIGGSVADKAAKDILGASKAAQNTASEAAALAVQLKEKLNILFGLEHGINVSSRSYTTSHNTAMEGAELFLNDLGFPAE